MKTPMPQPHPFAAAPASQRRVHATLKSRVTVYSYARVSTGGQSVDAQARQLRAAGAGKVFREVASGAKTDRPQLARVITELAAGDVVIVTRLDRLARSTRDLLNTLAAITEQESRLPLARRRMGRHHHAARPADADRLGGLAEFERELIRIRTGEGGRGQGERQSLGRKPKLTPHQEQEAIRCRDEGASVREIARTYNVSPSTISRLTA